MTSAVIVLVCMGLLLGLVIGVVSRLFGTEPDAKLEAVEELLPGANCGGCGYAGCAAFAKALLREEAAPNACPSNSDEAAAKICELLGIAAGERNPKVAVVCCGGDNEVAVQAARYNGVNDCKDAMQIAGGAKGCAYGCLGLGTCVHACPFGAIEITDQGLARVIPERCTGCGMCVQSCPRNLIKLVPAGAQIHILCNSPEKGGVKRKICKVSCIGCRKCFKEAEKGQISMNGFLAVVNYENSPSASLAEVCPTKCLVAVSGAAAGGDDDACEVANG